MNYRKLLALSVLATFLVPATVGSPTKIARAASVAKCGAYSVGTIFSAAVLIGSLLKAKSGAKDGYDAFRDARASNAKLKKAKSSWNPFASSPSSSPVFTPLALNSAECGLWTSMAAVAAMSAWHCGKQAKEEAEKAIAK